MSDCIFCKIIRKEIPAPIILENEHGFVIRDISPQAPTHLLSISKTHVESLVQTSDEQENVLGSLLGLGRNAMKNLGLNSFRTVINSGKQSGQSVFHMHFHFLGGKTFSADKL